MNAEQVYEKAGGSYKNALARLQRPALIIRLLKLFPTDTSMGALTAAVEEKDWAAAFRAVHTLKGVALNLSLDDLAEKSSVLTELLRSGQPQSGWEMAYDALCAAYRKTAEAIEELD